MSLWDWAVAAYAVDGVAEACLDLQDRCGQNTPLLLWAGWTAVTGRALDQDVIEAAVDTARAWERSATAPLRAIRRTLKTRIQDMADADRGAVREAVKALELDSERRLLRALEALGPAAGGEPGRPLEALVSVARSWDATLPRPALAALAERLPGA